MNEERISEIEIKLDKLQSIIKSYLEQEGYNVHEYYVEKNEELSDE